MEWFKGKAMEEHVFLGVCQTISYLKANGSKQPNLAIKIDDPQLFDSEYFLFYKIQPDS